MHNFLDLGIKVCIEICLSKEIKPQYLCIFEKNVYILFWWTNVSDYDMNDREHGIKKNISLQDFAFNSKSMQIRIFDLASFGGNKFLV